MPTTMMPGFKPTMDAAVAEVGPTPNATLSIRRFPTGATRDQEEDKYDYEGFLSPLVLERYAAYMHQHRLQQDGTQRASDNWQQGIPLASYMKSGWRHFMVWWQGHRGAPAGEPLEEALCALLFNVMGYLHEVLKAKPHGPIESSARVALLGRDRQGDEDEQAPGQSRRA